MSKNEKTPPKATKPRVGPVVDRLDPLTIHPRRANRQQSATIFLGKSACGPFVNAFTRPFPFVNQRLTAAGPGPHVGYSIMPPVLKKVNKKTQLTGGFTAFSCPDGSKLNEDDCCATNRLSGVRPSGFPAIFDSVWESVPRRARGLTPTPSWQAF